MESSKNLGDIIESKDWVQNVEEDRPKSDEINHTVRANMLMYEDIKESKYRERFNRMQFANPHNAISSVREYLFFTKPDLNIIDNTGGKTDKNTLRPELKNNSFWGQMLKRYRHVISDLQQSARRSSEKEDKHIFIPMLTNMVVSNLDMPNSSADTTETASTIYGTNIQYRKSSIKSDENYDFSLDFIDTPWLDVYHFFKMWDEYETLKDLGMIGPPSFSDDFSGYYRINKVLHDQISIYRFIVNGEDMETILHYSKFIGCFPKSVPRDAFNSFKGEGPITYSVDWHAQFVDDMNPDILVEFNELCKVYFGGAPNNKSEVPIYNENYHQINGAPVNHPYIKGIVKNNNEDKIDRFVLKWYD